MKAAASERAVRTIKKSLAAFWTGKKSRTMRWLEAVPNFVAGYNDRPSSATTFSPLDLINDPLLIPRTRTTPTSFAPLPPLNAFVRINKNRGIFEKESKGVWSSEIFRVQKHDKSQPIPMAEICDLMGEKILGKFYGFELQEIEWDGKKVIDKILRQRKRKGKTEYLVSYTNYPPKFTEWITDF